MKRIDLYALAALAVVLALVVMCGCKPTAPNTWSTTGNDLARIEARNVDAYQLGQKALNDWGNGKTYIGLQATVLLNQLADIFNANKGHDDDLDKIGWYAKHYDEVSAALDAERGHFFSSIQRHIVWAALIAIAAGYLIVWLVPGAGLFGTIANQIGHILPWGGKLRAVV